MVAPKEPQRADPRELSWAATKDCQLADSKVDSRESNWAYLKASPQAERWAAWRADRLASTLAVLTAG